MMRIAAMSRRFPPEYKRFWYIVRKDNLCYKVRIAGKTVPICFLEYHMLLDLVLMVTRHVHADNESEPLQADNESEENESEPEELFIQLDDLLVESEESSIEAEKVLYALDPVAGHPNLYKFRLLDKA